MEYYAFRSLKPINSRSGQNKAVICFKIPYIAASPIVVGMLKIKFMFGPLCRVQRLPPRLTLLQVCQYFFISKASLIFPDFTFSMYGSSWKCLFFNLSRFLFLFFLQNCCRMGCQKDGERQEKMIRPKKR